MNHPLIAIATLALAGCADGPPPSTLASGPSADPGPAPIEAPSLTALPDASAPPVKAVPFHGCTKIRFAALGAILSSRGLMMDGGAPGSAAALWAGGADALGDARYPERVRETLNSSTATSEKRDDVFVAAAVEIHRSARAGTWSPPSCPGAVLLSSWREFTLDGISCLLGKPARPSHAAVAHQAVSDVIAAADPTESAADARDRGERIAIAAFLSAAHGCE